jgi:flagellar FliL protein
LVNLADAGGNAYLRVSITLRIQDDTSKNPKPKDDKPEKGKPVNEFEAAERDAALDAIGRLTAVELLQTNGKELLKRQLAAAMMKRVPELKVTDIYFTEFLVQQ